MQNKLINKYLKLIANNFNFKILNKNNNKTCWLTLTNGQINIKAYNSGYIRLEKFYKAPYYPQAYNNSTQIKLINGQLYIKAHYQFKNIKIFNKIGQLNIILNYLIKNY